MKPRQTMWWGQSGSYQLFFSDLITQVGRKWTRKKFILNTIYHNWSLQQSTILDVKQASSQCGPRIGSELFETEKKLEGLIWIAFINLTTSLLEYGTLEQKTIPNSLTLYNRYETFRKIMYQHYEQWTSPACWNPPILTTNKVHVRNEHIYFAEPDISIC